VIKLDIYLFVSATRTIALPNGNSAKVSMVTEMPWVGKINVETNAPEGWSWEIHVPTPDYAENITVSGLRIVKRAGIEKEQLSAEAKAAVPGFAFVKLGSTSATLMMTFDLPVRLLANHPLEMTDTLTVSRGPIIYTAESFDNPELEERYPHFQGLGISSATQFKEVPLQIEGISMIGLSTSGHGLYALEQVSTTVPWRAVTVAKPARTWKKLNEELVLVPWFARANRGGRGHLRTSFMRADEA
jgi:DUF1680 family protein